MREELLFSFNRIIKQEQVEIIFVYFKSFEYVFIGFNHFKQKLLGVIEAFNQRRTEIGDIDSLNEVELDAFLQQVSGDIFVLDVFSLF